MSIFTSFETMEPASSATAVFAEDAQFAVDDTYWGYIVRSTEPASLPLVVLQVVAWVVGVSFCLATLGFWTLPSTVFQGPVIGMKLGASVVTGASAAFCLWFASRGTDSEIQIDTKLGEIREVVRNRAGRPTLIGRYGFDSIGDVTIEYGVARSRRGVSEGELVLRYRNSDERLHVARGALARLGWLRDRVGSDLMLSGRKAQARRSVLAS